MNKKYVTDNFYNRSGDTMTGNVNMGGHEILNLSDAVTTDNSAATKKYGDDKGGIIQGQADARYVRLTKLTLAEWTDGYRNISTSYDYPSCLSNWPCPVRKDTITANTT